MPLEGYISRKHLLGPGTLFFISSLLSCSGDEKELPVNKNNEEKVTLQLSINVDKRQRSKTRVPKEGSEVENYIDFENQDFQILVYDGEGNFKKELDNSREVTVLPDEAFYDLELSINTAIVDSEEIQLMLIANCKSFAGASYSKFNSNNKIWEGEYEFILPTLENNYSWYPIISESNKSDLIPMMGLAIGNLQDLKSEGGKEYLPLEINMTRTLAKVTFQVSDAIYNAGFDLAECNITYYNSKGSYFPYFNGNENQIAENGDILISKPSCPVQERVSTKLIFSNTGESDGKKLLVAYIPEMDNSNFTVNDGNRPKFEISLYDKNNNQILEETRFIELNQYFSASKTPQYDNGLFDILRNTWLDYTLSDIIKEDSDLTFSVDFTVCPWIEGDTNIRFE